MTAGGSLYPVLPSTQNPRSSEKDSQFLRPQRGALHNRPKATAQRPNPLLCLCMRPAQLCTQSHSSSQLTKLRPFYQNLVLVFGAEHGGGGCRTEQEAAGQSYGRNLRFLANVDPVDVARALNGLRPETTLVVVISKTFTTAETMLNARTVRCAKKTGKSEKQKGPV